MMTSSHVLGVRVSASVVWVAAVLLLQTATLVLADIEALDNVQVSQLKPFRSVRPMYAPADVASWAQVDGGRSYVRFDLVVEQQQVQQKQQQKHQTRQVHTARSSRTRRVSLTLPATTASASTIDGFGEVAVTFVPDGDDFSSTIGYQSACDDGGSPGECVQYCCTVPLYNDQHCEGASVGELVITASPGSAFTRQRFPVASPGSALSSNATSRFNRTGYYVATVSQCNTGLGDLTVSGTVTWMNPFGYLPGTLFGFLQFYQVLTWLYLAALSVWAVVFCLHRHDVLMIQWCITGVMLMSLANVVANLIDYWTYNRNGTRSHAWTAVAVLSGVMQRSVGRMLVVAVAMGWAVVRPRLGTDKRRIWSLGVCYCVSSMVLDIVTKMRHNMSQNSSQPPMYVTVLLMIPVSFADSIFYWWTFVSLNQLQKTLVQRRQHVKLEMYRSFTAILIFSLVAAVLIACYQSWLFFSNTATNQWQSLWFIEDGMHILYTVILFSIMWLWRPSSRTRRYGYSELSFDSNEFRDGGGEDDDEFGLDDLEPDEDDILHAHAITTADGGFSIGHSQRRSGNASQSYGEEGAPNGFGHVTEPTFELGMTDHSEYN